jgi:hypothetical protein
MSKGTLILSRTFFGPLKIVIEKMFDSKMGRYLLCWSLTEEFHFKNEEI